MSRKLEDSLPEYKRVERHTFLSGVGYTEEALDRPIIGVLNSWGEINPAATNLNRVTKAVKAGIWSAGGTPVEFVVSSMCTNMCGPGTVHFPHREMLAGYIEAVATANLFDGLVTVSVCDDVVPAHLMAAARLNLPAIVVTGGYMMPNRHKGQDVEPFDVGKKYYPAFAKGNIKSDDFNYFKEIACTGMGACPDMATANTMAAICEALGMSLPGTASLPGADSRLLRHAHRAGVQVVELQRNAIKPSDVMTSEAFENAIRLLMAIGGSPIAIIHLQAIALELGLDIGLATVNDLQQKTPFICNVSPSGKYNLRDLDEAGGIRAVMKELQPLLNTGVLTVSGHSVEENLRDARVYDRKVIYALKAPISDEGGLVFLKGTLAPRGAVVKQSAVPNEMLKFEGPARIFQTEPQACEALIHNKISAGEVVVIRYLGTRGAPGMAYVCSFLWMLGGFGLHRSVALITDGKLSGSNKGCAIAHITPEAAEGGPLAVVENGDTIAIDIPNRELNIKISAEELENRLQSWKPTEVKIKRGILSLYAKMAEGADKGAGLKY